MDEQPSNLVSELAVTPYQVNRDANGRVTAGSVLNPAGRPKGTTQTEKLRRMLETYRSTSDDAAASQSLGDQLLRGLLRLALAPDDDLAIRPQDRLEAIKYVLNRIEGTPRQSIDVSGAEINTVILNLREPERPSKKEQEPDA